ncbi:MAG: hypothetical protein GVY24_06035 [Planctomycetes bacterium]|nr:hypothetical protein [Planctomycetota bacterium]
MPTGSNLLRLGSQWLSEKRSTHCASTVTYQRGVDTYPVAATYGQTRYEIHEESGFVSGGHVWDFLIVATELPGIVPGAGDLIVADGRRYEVMPLGEDTQGWRWSDPFRGTYRIHTRDIGDAD